MEIHDLTDQISKLSIVTYNSNELDYMTSLMDFYNTICKHHNSKVHPTVAEGLTKIMLDELKALYSIYRSRYIDISVEQLKTRINFSQGYYWENRKQIYYWYITSINMDSVAALIPEDIGLITKLSQLIYSRNELIEVPNTVWNLSLLQHLDLSHNDIECVPDAVEGLSNVRQLLLNHNNIKTVSPNLYKLQQLQYIDLSYNPIKSMPSGIDKMKSLKTLRIHHTYMRQYPQGTEKITAFTTEQLLGDYTKNCMSWV